MVTRRVAKKIQKKAAAARRAALGFPVPTEPPRTGVNLVPEGYVGLIKITTPSGRVKYRFVKEDGLVFRDSHYWAGGRFHISRHAVSCRVEPAAAIAGLAQWQADFLSQVLAGDDEPEAPSPSNSLLAASSTLTGPRPQVLLDEASLLFGPSDSPDEWVSPMNDPAAQAALLAAGMIPPSPRTAATVVLGVIP